MNEIEIKFYNEFQNTLRKRCIAINDNLFQIDSFSIPDEEDAYTLYFPDNKKSILFRLNPYPDKEDFCGYIPDFIIEIGCVPMGFAIEIDGHEWHEKTKEQARADKEKERTYLKLSYIPIRFTGSEVYHDAKRCVNEVFEIMASCYDFFSFEDLDRDNYIKSLEIECLEKEKRGYIRYKPFVLDEDKICLRRNVLELGE